MFSSLQNHLMDSLTRIDCFADDLIHVISLDEERITSRGGEPECGCGTSSSSGKQMAPPPSPSDDRLTAIKEEDEDDYPFEQ